MKSLKTSTKHKLMKKILNSLIIIVLTGFTAGLQAQTTGGKIKGQVVDGSQKND